MGRRISRRKLMVALVGAAGATTGCSLPVRGGMSAPRGSMKAASVLRVGIQANADGKMPVIWQAIVTQAGSDGVTRLDAIPLPAAASTPAPSGTPTYDINLGLAQALAAAAPDRPDLLEVTGPTAFSMLQEGLIVPLDAAMAADRAFRPDDYLPGALDLLRVCGKQAALPVGIRPDALGYMPAQFTRVAASFPEGSWSRSQFIAAAVRLTQPADNGQPAQWGFLMTVPACVQFLLADGLVPTLPNGSSSGLGSAAAVVSLKTLADLWGVQKVARPQGATDPIAMFITPAQIAIGGGLNALIPVRYAEPPRGSPPGERKATRVTSLTALAMTPAAADPDMAFVGLRRLQAIADTYTLLPARVRGTTGVASSQPMATPTVYRGPSVSEVAALRSMATYGEAIRDDIYAVMSDPLYAFTQQRVTAEQAVEQMGKAAERVLAANG